MPELPRGPWKTFALGWTEESNRIGGVMDADGKNVFTATYHGDIHVESPEILRAILALPELVAVVREHASSSCHFAHGPDFIPCGECLGCRTRAALAKATEPGGPTDG